MIAYVALWVALPGLAIGMLLSLVRLVRGPSFPDRVVALDLLTTMGVGMIAAVVLAWEQPALLDVATVLALTSFLATIAFARYVERGIRSWTNS
jgi:multicomponent Na+:H+ antiporter subunit F